ncbi:Oidioi.mRNA.OKI2018_I69.chr2.g5077.t1.cds [Oikopleura dioica]|uniref:Oidioi.mRNA.OKI2018_I69.chr2.g5077.t1.cds n=1 Tax=Oikopleura dioica TaxID=34765 RepID=A0ABN7T4Y2_OIKDI|nr:Oidioi.mRNA.OKI2018_I69.chr2.g5077.t1.cds [Oikopleura dioica]
MKVFLLIFAFSFASESVKSCKDLEVLEENGGEIDGKDILMMRQKCRVDKKYEESLSKGKIRRLLSSVVTSLQELRKDFVHTRRVECGHWEQVKKISEILLKLDDKLIETLPKMQDDPTDQILGLANLLIHMHQTLEEKNCALSGQVDLKLEKGYLKKLVQKLHESQGENENMNDHFQIRRKKNKPKFGAFKQFLLVVFLIICAIIGFFAYKCNK